MAYTDYYDWYEFCKAFKDVASSKYILDPYFNLNEFNRGSKYKLDKNGYLFFIVGEFTGNFGKSKNYDILRKHPYVINYNFYGNNKVLKTKVGSIEFSLCVNDLKDAYNQSKSRKMFDIFSDVFAGKYFTKCHEISSKLCENYDYITTAFINSPLSGYKFLHSYIENENYVLDFSRNLKMTKNDYESLLNPDVVSRISGNELVDDIIFTSHNYPPMTLKNFLVRHDQLVLKR